MTVDPIETGTDQMRVAVKIPGMSDTSLFAWLTEPEKLAQWWVPTVPEQELVEGGSYHFAWPGHDFHLRGRYADVAPPRRLAFTWSFDHEPDLDERLVEIEITPTSAGARLTLTHGTYSDEPADQADRQNHIDGWHYFLSKLAEAVASEGGEAPSAG